MINKYLAKLSENAIHSHTKVLWFFERKSLKTIIAKIFYETAS